MSIDYTTVIGIDAKHLEQLCHTWPTWCRHKPGLPDHPILAFVERDTTLAFETHKLLSANHPNVRVEMWPFAGDETIWPGTPGDKWTDPHRFKMLSGFVHIPARHVNTEYWLKIDTDTIATGHPDWIDEEWFEEKPAIVAQSWGFTKPATQVQYLDMWAREHEIPGEGLNIIPKPGWSRVNHPRIISWCGFFRTDFTRRAARLCKGLTMPVASQDGFLWYLATRLEERVVRTNMKSRGWLHRSTMKNIIEESKKAMEI